VGEAGDRALAAGAPRRECPSDYSVTFYDPEDPDQWVCNSWIPASEADLSAEGLPGIVRRAGSRSWRDPGGTYWRIRTCPTRSGLRSDGDGTGETISFRRRDGPGATVVTRDVRALRPLAHLTDEELQQMLEPAA